MMHLRKTMSERSVLTIEVEPASGHLATKAAGTLEHVIDFPIPKLSLAGVVDDKQTPLLSLKKTEFTCRFSRWLRAASPTKALQSLRKFVAHPEDEVSL